MINIGEERYWKRDTNYENFVVLDYENGNFKIEYLTNGRIHIKSKEELEKLSLLSEKSSFVFMECKEISNYESGKNWLYTHKCRTCNHRLRNCIYL